MNRRLGSDDFELVTTAIITARQTGGELTTTLERLAALIRERVRINGKLSSMTAMGRMQAGVIALMPPLLLLGMYKVTPEVTSAAFHTTLGYLMLATAAVLIGVGYLIIRKITTIDV